MRLTNLALLSLGILVLLSCKEEEQKRRPNILFILADDLGAHDPGFTGSTFYETPHLDRLSRTSFVFTQGYANSRVCSPSRASIMTGKFTARHGITDWIGAYSGEDWRNLNRHDKMLPADYVHNLSKTETTLAEALKANGYTTFFAGKWHLGTEGSYPEDHGFDINKGGWEKGSPIGGFFSPWTNPRLENQLDGENLSLRLARETVQFLETYQDSTFFAFLSFYAVHAPIQTTEQRWSKYQQKLMGMNIPDSGFTMERVLPIRTSQDNPLYAGLLETMDESIGQVLNALYDLGLDDNTIVIFTSDNGGVASGDAFATSNLPLRGGKGYQWEGGIREPYLIHVPWLEGNAVHTPVTGADFYPTLMELAGLPPLPDQHIDGLSLVPLLNGQTLAERELYWHYPHYGNQGGEPSSIVREGVWKLIHYWEDGRDELYNLENDPQEQTDLSRKHPQLRQRLSEKLLTWLTSVDANTPEADPLYDAALAMQRKQDLRTRLRSRLEKQRQEMQSEGYSPNEDWWGSQPK